MVADRTAGRREGWAGYRAALEGVEPYAGGAGAGRWAGRVEAGSWTETQAAAGPGAGTCPVGEGACAWAMGP